MATILVIDDAAPIRLLLSTALQSDDHDVMQASSGREGLSLYQQRPLDLVIVDMLMPELNGLQTIMAFTRAFLNVKFIAVSGMGGDQTMLKIASQLGARQTLCKPFGMEELLWAVRYELTH
jgi:two-component system response regulator (stage 0 sporulation protein F)